MDKLDILILFVCIVEWGLFSVVVVDLGVFWLVVIVVIKVLEVSFGVWLLYCMIWYVWLMVEGLLYYQCCVFILVVFEEVNCSVGGSIFGIIWVDVVGNLVWILLLFVLLQFFVCYLDIMLQIGESECDVDLVCEGVDCVICGGYFFDSEMICWLFVGLQEIICVSLVYFVWYGILYMIEGLMGYVMIGFVLLCM